MQNSWRRKVKIGRSRGLSTVIGTIFFVIITLLITTNIFLWSITQHDLYNQAVVQSNQFDADKINERIIINSGNYSVAPSRVKVNATLINEGSVACQIVTLWVLDSTINKYNCTSLKSDNKNLGPGDEIRIDKSVTITGCQQTDDFAIWFVTARGNIIPFEKKQYVTVANIIQAMGPIQIKFSSLKWQSPTGNPPYSGTNQIPQGKKAVTWSVDVTNYDVQDIKLSYDSAFSASIPSGEPGHTKGETWYIKQQYTIPVGKIVTISFCWKQPGDIDEYPGELKEVGTYPVTITLLGYYDDDPNAIYGQAISFQAIKVYNP